MQLLSSLINYITTIPLSPFLFFVVRKSPLKKIVIIFSSPLKKHSPFSLLLSSSPSPPFSVMRKNPLVLFSFLSLDSPPPLLSSVISLFSFMFPFYVGLVKRKESFCMEILPTTPFCLSKSNLFV